MSLVLKSLEIEANIHAFDWNGVKPGETGGKVMFVDKTTAITFKLDNDQCARIFAVCADALISTAKEAATTLIIEAKAQQAKLVSSSGGI